MIERSLLRVSSSTLLLGAFLVGAALLVLTVPIGNTRFEVCWGFDGVLRGAVACPQGAVTKEVGYAAALNWSVVALILLPAFLYFAVSAGRSARRALRKLFANDMLVGRNFAPLTPGNLQTEIAKRLKVGRVVIGIMVVLITIVLGYDFWLTVFRYYFDPSAVGAIRLGNPTTEVDWSIAGPTCTHFATPGDECGHISAAYWGNAAFAALGYLVLPWAGAVMVCAFVVYLYLFGTMFTSGKFNEEGPYYLIPDLDSRDRRRGFEIFESFFINAVVASFLAFAFGYLVVLQNVYLRTLDPNLLAMLGDFPRLFDFVGNSNTIGVLAIGGLIAMSVIISVSYALRRAARRGGDLIVRAIERRDPNVDRVAISDGVPLHKPAILRALQSRFDYWPSRWLRLNTLLIALLIGLVSIFLVRIGFYLVLGGTLLVLVAAILRRWQAGPLRILMGIANPAGTAPLPELLDEMAGIDEAVEYAPLRGAYFKPIGALSRESLGSWLPRFKPSVLHFSGHGGADGIVLHENDTSVVLSADELRKLLVGSGVRVVVLNCCYSNDYAAALSDAVEAVVSVKIAVFDKAAMAFGIALYQSLVKGVTLLEAVEQGKDAAVTADGRREDFDVSGNQSLVLAAQDFRWPFAGLRF